MHIGLDLCEINGASKNGQIKKFISFSFKNVPLTVATYHQQRMCYHLAVRSGREVSDFLYAGDKISLHVYIFIHTYIYIYTYVYTV